MPLGLQRLHPGPSLLYDVGRKLGDPSHVHPEALVTWAWGVGVGFRVGLGLDLGSELRHMGLQGYCQGYCGIEEEKDRSLYTYPKTSSPKSDPISQ